MLFRVGSDANGWEGGGGGGLRVGGGGGAHPVELPPKSPVWWVALTRCT